MKRFLLVILLSLVWENLLKSEDFTTLDGDKYFKATVKKVEPDGLLITYPDGVVKLRFKQLPEEVRIRFGYNQLASEKFEALSKSGTSMDNAASNQLKPQGNESKSIDNHLSKKYQDHKFDDENQISIRNALRHTRNKFINLLKYYYHSFFDEQILTPAATPTPTPIKNPEQEVLKIINQPVIHVSDLVRSLDLYPDLTINMLDGRILKVTGAVSEIAVSGIDSERVELILDNIGSHIFCIKDDLNKDPLFPKPICNRRYSFLYMEPNLYEIETGSTSLHSHLNENHLSPICSIGNEIVAIVKLKKTFGNHVIFEALFPKI